MVFKSGQVFTGAFPVLEMAFLINVLSLKLTLAFPVISETGDVEITAPKAFHYLPAEWLYFKNISLWECLTPGCQI